MAGLNRKTSGLKWSEVKKFWYMFFIFGLFVIGFIGLIVWLILRSRYPTYYIVDFTIPKSDNDSFDYSLEIKNPDTFSDYYHDDIHVTFYHGQYTVGEDTIHSFYSVRRSTYRVADHVEVTDQQRWMAIRNSILNGTAELMKVALQTEIRYRIKYREYHHGVNLQAVIPIGPDGNISGRKRIKLGAVSRVYTIVLLSSSTTRY